MKTDCLTLLKEVTEKSQVLAAKIREVENNGHFQKLFVNSWYIGPNWQEELNDLEFVLTDVKKEINL
jgi:hypothetical protein